MKKQLVRINLKTMQWLAVLLFLVPMCISVPLELTALKSMNTVVRWYDLPIVIVAYFVLILAHEGLHALAMLAVGVSRKNIKFGAILKQGMLYCTCDAPMTADRYAFVLILPLIVTGLLPWILATVYLNVVYVCLFAGLISGAAGDVYMIVKLSRYPAKQLVLDHPEAPAFYLVYAEDALPEGFREVTEDEEQALRNELNKSRRKK